MDQFVSAYARPYLHPDGVSDAAHEFHMGAFWLALPTKTRPAAWKGMMSGWTAPGLIITALVIPRLKFMFPVLAIIVGIAYFARPRTRK